MPSDEKAAVLAYLQQAVAARTVVQIARATKLNQREVSAICLQLQKEGTVRRGHAGWKARDFRPALPPGASRSGPMGAGGFTVASAAAAVAQPTAETTEATPSASIDENSRWVAFR